MTTKEKLKQEMGARRPALRSEGLVRASEAVMRFLLAAVLSGADLPGGYAPLGVAFVGASGSGADGLCALLGAVFGTLCFRGPAAGLRDISAAVLVFSVAFALFDVKPYQKAWFMPVVTGALVGVTGFVSLTAGALTPAGAACFLTAVFLSGAAVYFDRIALSARDAVREDGLSQRQTVALLLFGGTLLMALARVTILEGLSVGRSVAALAVLCAGFLGGLGAGAAVGVCAGLAMDLAAGSALYCMAFGFAGLFSGAFRRQGRLFSALAFVLADGVAALWLWDAAPGAPGLLYEVFIASVVFVTLPERVFRALSARLLPARGNGADRRRMYVRERLGETAQAFQAVYENLRSSFLPGRDSGENPARIFDRAADRVCSRCPLRDACWQRDYQATAGALNDGLPAMLERGKGLPSDLPPWFASRCIHLKELLEAANGELAALLYRRRYQSRLQESRAAVCRQYGELSRVLGEAALELSRELTPEPVRERRLRQYLAGRGLEGETAVFFDEHGRLRAEILAREGKVLADEENRLALSRLFGLELRPAQTKAERGKTRVVFTQAEPLAVTAGVAARKRDGETVSGDSGAWFKGEDGVLWLLLCDGMGSGPEASRESDLAIRLLEKFLKAGVVPESALKTLNSALALRGEAEGGFTTVDLCRLDLFTGEGTVYKFGAAPTYLNKKGTVVRITGAALPAGLTAGGQPDPDVTPFHVEPGDCVLMLTDGVTDGEEDEWLREMLTGFDGVSPKELARKILEESAAHAASPDDRTVIVLQVCRR